MTGDDITMVLMLAIMLQDLNTNIWGSYNEQRI